MKQKHFFRKTFLITQEQMDALKVLGTPRVNQNEHVRRALDCYLSTPSIQGELKAAERKGV